MHQALYRKWRPQVFDDVYGQEHITSILKYETENRKFSHAYLFCGSRGTGKTTCAKILAKAVNCESPINGSPCNVCESCRAIDSGAATDVLEMDAASNNGVENIRDIRDEVVYTPSLLKYRVYIVDEVHMLSGSAFNALLKTLEEPPSHVVFILATTELHKLPATIISRCQRFDFRRISTEVLMERLSYIAKQEGILAEDAALRAIAKLAQGGMRDAISLLELCAGNRTDITEELVNSIVGSGGRENMLRTVKAIAESDYDTVFAVIDEVVRSSKDVSVFWQELLAFYRDILVIKTTSFADKYLDLTDSEREIMASAAKLFTKETLLSHCRMLDDSFYAMQRSSSSKRVIAEMALIKMTDKTLDTGNDNLLSRISKLELAMASGVAPRAVENKAQPKAEPSAQRKKETQPETPKEKEKRQAATQGGTVKTVRGWNEIVERAVGDEVYIAAFLKMAKCFIDSNNKAVVKLSNTFEVEMVERAAIKASLASVLGVELQMPIGENDISFEVADSSQSFDEDLSSLDT